jgi:hypothetical protein
MQPCENSQLLCYCSLKQKSDAHPVKFDCTSINSLLAIFTRTLVYCQEGVNELVASGPETIYWYYKYSGLWLVANHTVVPPSEFSQTWHD